MCLSSTLCIAAIHFIVLPSDYFFSFLIMLNKSKQRYIKTYDNPPHPCQGIKYADDCSYSHEYKRYKIRDNHYLPAVFPLLCFQLQLFQPYHPFRICLPDTGLINCPVDMFILIIDDHLCTTVCAESNL